MGISPFGHSKSSFDSYGSNNNTVIKEKIVKVKAPNPDPEKFTLLSSEVINGYLALEIKYDGCTNFEGHKLLLFDRNVNLKNILLQNNNKIDPNFSNNQAFISPIARFVPNDNGWRMLRAMCEQL